MDDAFLAVLGFTTTMEANHTFGKIYSGPNDFELHAPGKYESCWSLRHGYYDGNNGKAVNSPEELVIAMYEFGVEDGQKGVKDTLRDIFGSPNK